MRKRWTLALEFKAELALDAAAGESTLAEPAAKHDIEPPLIQRMRVIAEPSS